ncbi:MAG: hypothetical protein ABJL67_12215, partial [Sulfitobacter sp.]
MSWRVANTCAERKFGSATRKQIIMFLADKASDDGSGIWCSKGTIQRHTELGETTVKRTVRAFLKEGILVETGARTCKNGFTVVYRIDLAKVEALEPTLEPEIETGSTVAPVQSGPGTGATVAGVPGPPRPPNHPKTIHKPPTRKREAVEDEEAQKILAAYPPDRLRGKATCLAQIEEAMKEGIAPEDLLQAVQAYENAFDSLRDMMNQRHGWADPMELERVQEVRDTIETPTRAQGRDELHAWLQDQISVGLITDRASMLDALIDAGFDIPRAGKAYLTAQDPDTGERWRLKGEIFHENWQADTAEREAERGAGHDPAGLRRLDGIPAGELQNRFEQHCDQRAAYNRDRYPQLSATEQELADDLALADHGDVLGGDRLDDGREFALDVDVDQLGDDRTGPDADRQGGRDLAGAGPDQDAAE